LPTGHNGRGKVGRSLRALDHPEIYVAGEVDPGHLATVEAVAMDPKDRHRPRGGALRRR